MHMSDAEFVLYQNALHEGFAGLGATEEDDLLNKINSTEKISAWFTIADDRRST